MDCDTFARQLAAAGFAQTTTVERPAGGMLDVHTHPFEARAMVLYGEITIVVNGATRTYRSGDIFHLEALCPHAESYGPQGVTYLVGRR